MDTLYYRKIAQIAHRDGDETICLLAARVINAPKINSKQDRRALKKWFQQWLEQFPKR